VGASPPVLVEMVRTYHKNSIYLLFCVGHSINLYNRISAYFMPSILKTMAQSAMLHNLNKHGFSDMELIIYIMNENSSLEQVVELEQYFIDTLKP
jgi:hypothetical protein